MSERGEGSKIDQGVRLGPELTRVKEATIRASQARALIALIDMICSKIRLSVSEVCSRMRSITR